MLTLSTGTSPIRITKVNGKVRVRQAHVDKSYSLETFRRLVRDLKVTEEVDGMRGSFHIYRLKDWWTVGGRTTGNPIFRFKERWRLGIVDGFAKILDSRENF